MRPTGDELLIGVRSILENVIAPEVKDTWALGMAGQMSSILEHLVGRPEREKAYIANQNAELRALVAQAAGYFEQHVRLDAAGQSELERLRKLAQEPPAASAEAQTILALAQQNDALRDALVWAIETLNKVGGHRPEELATAKLGIRQGLKKMLEDDFAFWSPMGLGPRPARR